MALRRNFQRVPFLGLLTILAFSGFTGAALAASHAGSPTATPSIVEAVDDAKLVKLGGHTHPLATAQFDQGAVANSFPMEHMFLQLRRSPGQEEALSHLMDELQDPESANYHQWLSAEELGTRFGPAEGDIDTVVQWLGLHGFKVNDVYKNGLTIDISGTAGQVLETFHTEIHNYAVNGKQHIANASDPQIPAAMAPVVSGFVSLHDFMPKPALSKWTKSFTLGLNGSTFYFEAPGDLATIYNVTPLYKAKKPITGKGQTVVVLEDTDISPADVAKFRSSFGLSKYSGTFTQVHPGAGCIDPGKGAAELEAALDAEWAGAVAPDAAVKLASCADSSTTLGAFFAAQGLLDSKNPPPIMSLSYIGCEVALGPSFNAYVNALWQQAAGEGVSVFVASGDGSAAGCDDFNTGVYATQGIAANGLASTPYNVATGGTDFLDTYQGTNSTYWTSGNTSTGKSAKSYIPEMPWNTTCASNILFSFYGYKSGLAFCNSSVGSNFFGIVGGSGAPSFVYPKPKWQAGVVGNPTDGKRDLPDVSLFASNGFWGHEILFCMSDENQGGAPCDYTNSVDTVSNAAGGTSFTAPQFASIQALINQKAGGRQGNPAPIYYKLDKAEFGNSAKPNESSLKNCSGSKGKNIGQACLFHDTTAGNNAVPCYGTNNCYQPKGNEFGILSTSDSHLLEAYPTTTGWDFATGLGSINVTNIVNHWP